MSGNEGWLKERSEWLQFVDMVNQSPVAPPRVQLYSRRDYSARDKHDYWSPGFVLARETVQSMLVRADDYTRCKEFGLHDVRAAQTPFLVGDDGSSHVPAGIQTHKGIEVESIYFEHTWDGLDGKSLLAPSQHLVLYLGLEQDHSDHVDRTTWSDPLDVKTVIERIDKQGARSETQLLIELDYLRDYLAARRKALFVLRWAERFVTYGPKDPLPWDKSSKQETAAGYIEYEEPRYFSNKVYPTLRATLWGWYRIDPAAKPRHWMLDTRGECVEVVEFTGPDGNPVRFDSGRNFLRVISFKRDMLSLFNKPDRPRWKATNTSPGQLAIRFPRGQGLWASDSPHGQIQVLLGDLVKLDDEYQKILAPFSEMQRGKPHSEWFNSGFMCIPAKDLPWHERLQRAQLSAHRTLSLISKRNPIRAISPTPLDETLLRPSTNDQSAFFQAAKVIRRNLLDEGRTNEWYDPEACPVFTQEGGVGSIGAIKGLMRQHSKDRLDLVKESLDTLNRFRQVDAHAVDVEKVLDDTGYSSGDYASRYDKLMESICTALEIVADTAYAVAKKLGRTVAEEADGESEADQ